MSPEDRQAAARDILAIRLFNDLMDELEQSAVDRAVNAKITDDETRAACLSQVRGLRDLRAQIEALANAGQSKPVKRAPA